MSVEFRQFSQQLASRERNARPRVFSTTKQCRSRHPTGYEDHPKHPSLFYPINELEIQWINDILLPLSRSSEFWDWVGERADCKDPRSVTDSRNNVYRLTHVWCMPLGQRLNLQKTHAIGLKAAVTISKRRLLVLELEILNLQWTKLFSTANL